MPANAISRTLRWLWRPARENVVSRNQMTSHYCDALERTKNSQVTESLIALLSATTLNTFQPECFRKAFLKDSLRLTVLAPRESPKANNQKGITISRRIKALNNDILRIYALLFELKSARNVRLD